MLLALDAELTEIADHAILFEAPVRDDIEAVVEHAAGQRLLGCTHPAQHGIQAVAVLVAGLVRTAEPVNTPAAVGVGDRLETPHRIEEKLRVTQVGLLDVVEQEDPVVADPPFLVEIVVGGKLFQLPLPLFGGQAVQPLGFQLPNRDFAGAGKKGEVVQGAGPAVGVARHREHPVDERQLHQATAGILPELRPVADGVRPHVGGLAGADVGEVDLGERALPRRGGHLAAVVGCFVVHQGEGHLHRNEWPVTPDRGGRAVPDLVPGGGGCQRVLGRFEHSLLRLTGRILDRVHDVVAAEQAVPGAVGGGSEGAAELNLQRRRRGRVIHPGRSGADEGRGGQREEFQGPPGSAGKGLRIDLHATYSSTVSSSCRCSNVPAVATGSTRTGTPLTMALLVR